MTFSLAEQTLVFLQAILLGVAGGLVYDLFRAVRRTTRMGTVGTAFVDALFWLIVLGALFYFAVTDGASQMRSYVLLGEGLGMALHFLCFTPLILPLVMGVIRFVVKSITFPVRLVQRLCIFCSKKLSQWGLNALFLKKIKKRLPFFRHSG